MNEITKKLLANVARITNQFRGAYYVRENGSCTAQQSSDHIRIIEKKDKPGLDIYVDDHTVAESVCLPAIVNMGGIEDVVYNDFHIGEDCDITIVSGCGVHTDDACNAEHDGIHHFEIGKRSHVRYEENHYGSGVGEGHKVIHPTMEMNLQEGSFLEIHAVQIRGVDQSNRKTHATLAAHAKLIIHERLYTDRTQKTTSVVTVELNGDQSSADLISRSVAKDASYQSYKGTIIGNAACNGHVECDSLIDGDAIVDSSPCLFAHNKEAALIHEAAIGKIAQDQILKLETLGLTKEQAENEIIEGFLS